MDYWAGTVLICVLAMIQSITYAWILGVERAQEEVMQGAKLNIPGFVQNVVLKYISPAYLIFLMVFLFSDQKDGIVPRFNSLLLPENRVALISFSFMLLVVTFITLLVHIAGVRWIKQGKMKNVLPDGTLKPLD
jgi:hypothetical protein